MFLWPIYILIVCTHLKYVFPSTFIIVATLGTVLLDETKKSKNYRHYYEDDEYFSDKVISQKIRKYSSCKSIMNLRVYINLIHLFIILKSHH